MEVHNNDRAELLGNYENAIINRHLPDEDKIISLRAKLGEPFETDSLDHAEQNIRQRIRESYTIVLLGLKGLNVDVVNTIFRNIIGSTSLMEFKDLQDWNENLSDKILVKILEDETRALEEHLRKDVAAKKAAHQKSLEKKSSSDRAELLGNYENAIINRSFPDEAKIISLRAKLGEPFETDSLDHAEQNIRQRLRESYTIVLLGLKGLNVDVVNAIFKNIIGFTSLMDFKDLQDWNENLSDKIVAKIMDEETKALEEQLRNDVAVKRAAQQKNIEKKSSCNIF